ncbi:MAG TPA: GNAT family N-acetyltransferase [Gemmatimonadaceae bacterium]
MAPPAVIDVRRATLSDADALARMRLEFRGPRAPAVESEQEFLERCTQWMRSRLAEDSVWRVWVVEHDREPVGNVWLQIVEKLPNPTAETELHAYVSNFYVRPTHRNGGVGSLLLAEVMSECARLNVDSVFLWATARSRPLYLRHGFAPSDGVLVLKR